MTPRDTFILALRILGIYGVTQSVAHLPYAALVLLRSLTSIVGAGITLAVSDEWLLLMGESGGALLLYFFISLILLVFAPRIAGIFYPDASSVRQAEPRTMDVRHLYCVGAVLLGLYVVVEAVPGAVRMAAWLLSSDSLGARPYMAQDTMTRVTSAAVYVVIGTALILFSRRIADWASQHNGA